MEFMILDFKVLAADDDAAMGFALLGTWKSFPEEPLVLDTYVHPNFAGDATALVQAVNLPDDEPVYALSDSASEGRGEALESVGFALEATLSGAVTDDAGQSRDLLIYVRG